MGKYGVDDIECAISSGVTGVKASVLLLTDFDKFSFKLKNST